MPEGVLPADVKDIFLKLGQESTDKISAIYPVEDEKIVTDLKKKGNVFLDFPAADREKWANLPQLKAYVGQWVKSMEDKGLPGQAVYDAFAAGVKK